MGADALTPWWVATAAGVVSALAGVIGKLWADHRRELRELRAELAEANARVVELQEQATERGDEHQREHVRDLRRIAGLSRSIDPPPAWPPVIIRATPERPARSPRKALKKEP